MIFSEKKTLHEFVDDTFDTEQEKQELHQYLDNRKVVSHLTAMRIAKGVTQEDVAKQRGCKQSAISKLESGVDASVSLCDLEAYAKACGSEMTILISDRGLSIADQIKMHAFAIRRLFMKLVGLAHKDDAIAKGVAELHMQAFQNINKMLMEISAKLPACAEVRRPFIRVTHMDGKKKAESAEIPTRKRAGKSRRGGMAAVPH